MTTQTEARMACITALADRITGNQMPPSVGRLSPTEFPTADFVDRVLKKIYIPPHSSPFEVKRLAHKQAFDELDRILNQHWSGQKEMI